MSHKRTQQRKLCAQWHISPNPQRAPQAARQPPFSWPELPSVLETEQLDALSQKYSAGKLRMWTSCWKIHNLWDEGIPLCDSAEVEVSAPKGFCRFQLWRWDNFLFQYTIKGIFHMLLFNFCMWPRYEFFQVLPHRALGSYTCHSESSDDKPQISGASKYFPYAFWVWYFDFESRKYSQQLHWEFVHRA